MNTIDKKQKIDYNSKNILIEEMKKKCLEFADDSNKNMELIFSINPKQKEVKAKKIEFNI